LVTGAALIASRAEPSGGLASAIVSVHTNSNHLESELTAVHQDLTYDTLEKLRVRRPVDRIGFIAELCRGKRVLDIGCFDETALIKRDTEHWLHGRIAAVAREVVGIDNSAQIPPGGLATGTNSKIFRGDGINPATAHLRAREVDIVVAGEFIEHIESPLQFFRNVKSSFPGRELIVSTPNGIAIANTLLGTIDREVQHRDHLHAFTFKVLNTLCMRAEFEDWEIIPYRFYATEMILQSRGARRVLVILVEQAIRVVERVFPLLSFGYIVRIRP
jgi:SAM-dependent methyltransferase